MHRPFTKGQVVYCAEIGLNALDQDAVRITEYTVVSASDKHVLFRSAGTKLDRGGDPRAYQNYRPTERDALGALRTRLLDERARLERALRRNGDNLRIVEETIISVSGFLL